MQYVPSTFGGSFLRQNTDKCASFTESECLPSIDEKKEQLSVKRQKDFDKFICGAADLA